MPALPTLTRTRTPHPVEGAVYATADRRRAWLITLLYLVVVAIGAAYHELWRDEWQAWMLARDSGSIPELLRNIQHEGHPPAWYLILFAVSRLTRNAAAMQATNVLVASAAVFVLARFSPMPWVYRVLIPFGYFFIFEYGVISRSYALTALALFCACALFRTHRRHAAALALSLAVLATVSVYGLILAIALSLALLHERVGEQRVLQWIRELHLSWKILFVISVLAAAVAVQVMLPPDGITSRPLQPDRFTTWGAAASTGTLAWGYAPIPDLADPHIWNTHVIPTHTRNWVAAGAILGALFVTATILLFARSLSVLVFYVAATAGLLVFQHVFFMGTLRHYGHYFLAFIAGLWLAHADLRTWRPPHWLGRFTGPRGRAARGFVIALLAVQCIAGAILFIADVRQPFSAAEAAARILREHGLNERPIGASPAPLGAAIAGNLDRPLFYIATQSEGTFVPWGRYARSRDERLDMGLLRTFIDSAAADDVVLVLGAPFEAWDADLEVREVARLAPGLEHREGYVIYDVRRSADP